MRSALSLDGKAYFNLHVVSCKRSFSVLDGDNAGRVMTGAMTRDIIGTYYNYSLEIDPVANGDDELTGSYDGRNDWGNLTINFVAMKPKRTPV